MYDMIPLRKVESGVWTYTLFERIDKRGKNAWGVTEMFKRTIQWAKKPHLLPDQVSRKLKYGPRVAAWGYKV